MGVLQQFINIKAIQFVGSSIPEQGMDLSYVVQMTMSENSTIVNKSEWYKSSKKMTVEIVQA